MNAQDRLEDLEFLLSVERNVDDVARRTGFRTLRSAERWCYKQGRPDLARKFAVFAPHKDVYSLEWMETFMAVFDVPDPWADPIAAQAARRRRAARLEKTRRAHEAFRAKRAAKHDQTAA